MDILYWPGLSRSAGKLYLPLSSLTTVTVMLEPSFFALTRTPSIGPSSADEICPLSAVCACAGLKRNGATPTPTKSRSLLTRMVASPGYVSSDFFVGDRLEKGHGGAFSSQLRQGGCDAIAQLISPHLQRPSPRF